MSQAHAQTRSLDSTAALLRAADCDGQFVHLWGRSPAMLTLYMQIARVADTAVSVFISGESGSGKELVAQTIHDLSRRSRRPFLAINCGAISPQLIESEIFGHERGSFTGAERQHLGIFERADGGTLFLDEITEMPQELQVKLLRVLETGTFMRVGASRMQRSDVRVIAATNRALIGGHLREDLLYRLNVFPLVLPPLRERPGDAALLAQYFLQQLGQREGQIKQFTPAALLALAQQRWPGNVRELRNTVQRAYLMSLGEQISEEWTSVLPTILPQVQQGAEPCVTIALGTALQDAERRLILATLTHYGQHKERSAAVLGISLKTLYNRLKNYEGRAFVGAD